MAGLVFIGYETESVGRTMHYATLDGITNLVRNYPRDHCGKAAAALCDKDISKRLYRTEWHNQSREQLSMLSLRKYNYARAFYCESALMLA
jgi:hypothetical protein